MKISVTPGHKSDKHVNTKSLFHMRRLPTLDPRQIFSIKAIISNSVFFKRLRWSTGSVLAFGTQIAFKPDRGRWIFQREKNPQHAFLRRGSKAVRPMS